MTTEWVSRGCVLVKVILDRPGCGRIAANMVWLRVPRTFRIHMPINVKELKPYIVRDADLGGPPESPPEPIVVDGADHWEVEAVLAEQTKGRKRYVLVKWCGFDITSATWEPLENIPEQFIQQYRKLSQSEDQCREG